MEIHRSGDIQSLSRDFADWLVTYEKQVLAGQDRFTIALSGGSTPKLLHQLLAAEPYRSQLNWSKWHIFWGDERFVPLADDRSNARMAYETLLDLVPIPAGQIHVMPTENISPEESATAYERILTDYFGTEGPGIDLLILGMGDDGHTLSLFPGLPVIHEENSWVTSLWLEAQDMYRITLTHPFANLSGAVAFLAAGSNKAGVLKEVLEGDYNPDLYPSQIISPINGNLHWFIDEAAAVQL